MSEFVPVPQWLQTKTNEAASENFLAWIASTQQKLLKAFPQAERAFSRILHKMLSRIPRRWKKRFWYTRQKYFIVSPEIVFFGDFHFRNLSLLVEIDGSSHSGQIAREKDEWRSRLISLWREASIVRITNNEVIHQDFRTIEHWLIEQAAACCTENKGDHLIRDYKRMRKEHPDIYNAPGIMTTY